MSLVLRRLEPISHQFRPSRHYVVKRSIKSNSYVPNHLSFVYPYSHMTYYNNRVGNFKTFCQKLNNRFKLKYTSLLETVQYAYRIALLLHGGYKPEYAFELMQTLSNILNENQEEYTEFIQMNNEYYTANKKSDNPSDEFIYMKILLTKSDYLIEMEKFKHALSSWVLNDESRKKIEKKYATLQRHYHDIFVTQSRIVYNDFRTKFISTHDPKI